MMSMSEIMDTKEARGVGRKRGASGRKSYTPEEKRRIVDESFRPGASVSRIARNHDINTNLLFTWRRQHGRGELVAAAGSVLPAALLPVTITQSNKRSKRPAQSGAAKVRRRKQPAGLIEIDLPGASIRIHGHADREALAQVLSLLRR